MIKYNYNFSKNDYKTPPVLYQMALDTYGKENKMTDENIEDLEYFRAMAKDYGEKLDALYNIIKNSDWINIGTKAKHSIEKMFVILHNYKKELQNDRK